MAEIPTQRDWSGLRAAAVAAETQLRTGKREWPGRPSAQRLALFLAASPAVVLELVDEIAALRGESGG